MDREDLLRRLRAADEQTVGRALAAAYIELEDIPSADLLEFFNRMVDELLGEEES